MKVFISQPMRGKTECEIREARNEAELAASVYLQERFNVPRESIKFIDSILKEKEGKPFKENPVWYLGKSIRLLSKADIAFFFDDWHDYNGCLSECFIAQRYGIPVVDMSK